mmetsp:Transcript_23593/g.55908  ORF Transcript_23593/g.55908 Transcript_23593/m.55908 type:complete len:304 (-) Transcript_23593:249-1160(-)
MTTMVVPLIHDPSKTNSHEFGFDEDADLCLSELTENSLMISTTHEVSKLQNNTRANFNKAELYSNGLLNMISSSPSPSSPSTTITSSGDIQNKNVTPENSSGPTGASGKQQTTDDVTDVGLLTNFPRSWNDWESNRRHESMNHWKKYQNKKQMRIQKRIKRKSIEPTKAKASASTAIFHRRRLSLDRSIGRHLREGCLAKRKSALKSSQAMNQSDVVPFQSSKSLRRRQRRRVVRFREEISEEILDWKRERQSQQQRQKGVCSGRGLGMTADTETPFLEAQPERKQRQRALLDLQVGMKCMGL